MHGEAKKKIIDITAPENQVSGAIIDTAIYIHKKLGPGLLESAYEESLAFFLEKEGLKVERQKILPITIDDLVISTGFRTDLIVEDSVICEIKSLEKLAPVHTAQLMTYLKLSGIKTGLLMNFGETLFKNGLKRIVV